MRTCLLAIFALAATASPIRAIDWPGGADEHAWKESPPAVTDREVRKLGFDAGTLERLNKRTGAAPELFPRDSAAPIGLSWRAEGTMADEIVTSERQWVVEKGYVIFIAERNFGTEPDRIALARTEDPLAPVVWQRTSGPNVGVSTQEVLAKLREWKERAPYDLLGAGRDWVEIQFREVPPKLEAFVEEIRELAPDSLGRTPEALGTLQEEIRRTRRVLLFWDET